MRLDPLAQLLPSTVHVYGVTYDDDDASTWRGWLSEEERSCMERFGAQSRRREFLAGRAAARRLLADCLGMSPEEVPLRRAEDEAVDVGKDHWHVSIAHSGPLAVAACARQAVGIDLERIQPRDPGLRSFLFRPEDRGLVDRLPYDEEASLLLCWTLKEAVLKARRTGFRTSPKDLQLSVQPERSTATVLIDSHESWRLLYTRQDGFWAAVALPDS